MGRKILASIFLGSLIGEGVFGDSKLMLLFFVLYHIRLSGYFYGLEIRHGIFLVLKFGPRIFLGFDFFPHSIIPVT